QRGIDGLHVAQEVEPVGVAEAEIEKDEMRAEDLQRAARRRRGGRDLARVAAPAEEARQRAGVDLLVVDDQDGRHGRLISTAVPSPGRLLTVIDPSCAVTIFCASASPSPVPDFLLVEKSVKSFDRRSGGMPGPVSSTRMRANGT